MLSLIASISACFAMGLDGIGWWFAPQFAKRQATDGRPAMADVGGRFVMSSMTDSQETTKRVLDARVGQDTKGSLSKRRKEGICCLLLPDAAAAMLSCCSPRDHDFAVIPQLSHPDPSFILLGHFQSRMSRVKIHSTHSTLSKALDAGPEARIITCITL